MKQDVDGSTISPRETWGEIVTRHFPEADDAMIDFILWEMTCYPFSTTGAIKQIEELAARVRPLEPGWQERMRIQNESKTNPKRSELERNKRIHAHRPHGEAARGPMTVYFVSYHIKTADGDGFGNAQATTQNPISTMDDVTRITEGLKKQFPDAQGVVIMNWRELDGPSQPPEASLTQEGNK